MANDRVTFGAEVYQDIVEKASDLIQCVDSAGKIIYVNHTWKDKLGYTESDLANLVIWDIIHPDSIEHCQQAFQRVISGENIGLVDAVFLTKDGASLPVEGSVNCRFDENNKFLNTRGLFRDLTLFREKEVKAEEHRKLIEEQIQLQRLLSEATASFSNAGPDDFDEKVNHALRRFGEHVSADRVYIFEYLFDQGVCNNTYEWCQAGIHPEIDQLQNVPLEMMIDWVDAHTVGETIYIPDVFALSPEDGVRILLEPQGVKSLITLPMMNEGVCEGFIGFDSVKKNHQYTKNEEKILWELSNVLRSAISRVSLARALRESEAKYRYITDNIADVVFSMDLDLNMSYVSPSVKRLVGDKPEVYLEKKMDEKFPSESLERISQMLAEELQHESDLTMDKARTRTLEVEHFSQDGSTIWLSLNISLMRDKTGTPTGLLGVARDVTENREKQKLIEFLSLRDHLTGLYNRRYIEDSIKRLDTKRNYPFAIMILDINGLKLTNDAFGHELGDQLLRTVADIMCSTVRGDDIVGRMGGDEFALLLPKTDAQSAESIKQRICETAANTKLESIIVSLAVGYAVKTSHEEDIGNIIKLADNNMYRNKLIHGKTMRSQTIETLIRSINNKFDQEQIHTERVSQYSGLIARALKFPEKEVNALIQASHLHDIGKIVIPAALLNKPGKLTEKESNIVKQHPRTGYHLLKNVDEYAPLAEFALYHHEFWDGSGYPQGLKGEEIPIEARIIAVADAYEAMTAYRRYQDTKTNKEALQELKRCAGTQFDPDIVDVFICLMEQG